MLINSVTGPIKSEDLGRVLIHEHVVNLHFSMWQAFGKHWFDKDVCFKIFKEEIDKAKQYGLKTYVDATPIDLGRDIGLLKEAADFAEIQMLASTGVYWVEDPFYTMDVEAEYLAELLLKDINNGIEGTTIKPALIKCATDVPGPTPINKKMLKGSALASKASGIPVYTHSTAADKAGLYQIDELTAQDLDPHLIAIGHCFDTVNKDYLKEIMDRGCYAACDRVGLRIVIDTESLAECVADLCKEGYTKQIMLSHDGVIENDFGFSLTTYRRDRKKNLATGGYSEVFEVMLPLLREHGISDEDIDTMLIENPARYLTGQKIV